MALSHLHFDRARALEAVRRAAAHGLELAMEHILAEAKKIAPLDEGTLERSGRARVDATRLQGIVSFSTPYAVRQHEELTWRHAPGRQAKYLEVPFFAQREVALALVAAEIRRALATGGGGG
ncbi:hypothetical protein ACWEO1_22560 [Kitasatospora cineracea]